MERTDYYTEYQAPFCRPVKCLLNGTGNNKLWVDGEYAEDVLWNCLPDECKNYLTLFLAIIAVLAVMTVTFNCLILGINLTSRARRMRRRNPTMSNYSTYVISIAVADLLVGVVVLPLCIANFYFEYMSYPISGLLREMQQKRETIRNNTLIGNYVTKSLPRRLIAFDESAPPDMAVTTETPNDYNINEIKSNQSIIIYDLLGVFTHLTLFVSMYTLISASADRFYAATNSVNGSRLSRRSNKEHESSCFDNLRSSCQRSTIAVFLVWILGLAFALAPLLMQDKFHFRHLGHVFAVMTSDVSYTAGLQWYLIMLIFPLVGMWVLNILICYTLWRRKRQLKIRRQRSLRRSLGSKQTKDKAEKAESSTNPVPKPESAFMQVEDKMRPQSVLLYPSARWNQKDDENGNFDPTMRTYTSPRVLHGRKNCKGSVNSISKSSQKESRSSGIRRTVSSIRRAKELLRNQSYEANITKTLCTVVFSFTIAVLPIIVVTSCSLLREGGSLTTRNKEVTALSCSLLLLFSNSFFNCVIYGARMRDFRSGVLHFLRTSVVRAKTVFCCSCERTYDLRYFSESGSHLFGRTKSASCEPSPRPGSEFPRNRARYAFQSSSKKLPTSTKKQEESGKVIGHKNIASLPVEKPNMISFPCGQPFKDSTSDRQLSVGQDEFRQSTSDLQYVTCYSPSDVSRRTSQIAGMSQDIEQTIYTRRQHIGSVSTLSSLNRRVSWRNSDIDPFKVPENHHSERQSMDQVTSIIASNMAANEDTSCDGKTESNEKTEDEA